jgi:hypothetical protein
MPIAWYILSHPGLKLRMPGNTSTAAAVERRHRVTPKVGNQEDTTMAGLQEFHHTESRDKTTKIVAWVVIALLVGGFGVYVVQSDFFNPNQTVQNYPRGL